MRIEWSIIMKIFIAMIGLTLAAGCTTYRAIAAKTTDDVSGIGACVHKADLTKRIGGPDQVIKVPGGGYIEIHEVLLRNEETTRGPLTAAFISIGSFGIVDMTAGLIDASYECGASSGSSGLGVKCDYSKMRYIAHYADANAQQMACLDVKEVRVGDAFYAAGDQSRCPKEYKDALSKLIDTSEFPKSNIALSEAPSFASTTVSEQLDFMTTHQITACGG